MIHVIASIEHMRGKRDEFLEEFRRIVPLVRAEAGCLDYEPNSDMDSGLGAQLPFRSNVVTVVERWESLDALKAHQQAPHMQEFRERVKHLVVEVQLQVLKPL